MQLSGGRADFSLVKTLEDYSSLSLQRRKLAAWPKVAAKVSLFSLQVEFCPSRILELERERIRI